jgi:hypothetical protein
MRSLCFVYVREFPPINFETWYVYNGTWAISTAYFINPSHQSMCLYVYPSIVARQRSGKNITSATSTQQLKNSWICRFLCGS